MIQINLLPQETTSARGAGGPALPGASSGALAVAAILIPVYIVLLLIGFYVWNMQASEQRAVAELEAEKRTLEQEIRSKEAEYQELTNAMLNVENQLALLQILDPEDRLYWAEKLNILPMLVPEGVHLTNIAVSETVREVETEESRRRQAEWNAQEDKTGQPPPRITRPVITQTLNLAGLAYVSDGTSNERLQLIVDFNRALLEGEVEVPFSGETTRFIDGFRPLIPYSNVRGEQRDGRDVATFNFEMTTIPVSIENPGEGGARGGA